MARLATLGFLLTVLTAGSAVAEDTAQAELESVNQSFSIKGRPVHPNVLRDLQPLLSDNLPYVVAIDLAASAGSNKYFDGEVNSSGDRWVFVEQDGGRFSYLWRGRLDNGLHIVQTAGSADGTGEFYTLHFLGVALMPAFDGEGNAYRRVALSTVRQVPLGDRWRGTIELNGNQVTVSPDGGGDAMVLDGKLP